MRPHPPFVYAHVIVNEIGAYTPMSNTLRPFAFSLVVIALLISGLGSFAQQSGEEGSVDVKSRLGGYHRFTAKGNHHRADLRPEQSGYEAIVTSGSGWSA